MSFMLPIKLIVTDPMPYCGYTIQELVKLFRRSKQALYQSGILEQIKKAYPFGEKFPLFDIDDVQDWHLRLLRFDGLVALALLPKRGRGNFLQHAPTTNQYDSNCPNCKSFAVYDSSSNRFWCANCQIIQLEK